MEELKSLVRPVNFYHNFNDFRYLFVMITIEQCLGHIQFLIDSVIVKLKRVFCDLFWEN